MIRKLVAASILATTLCAPLAAVAEEGKWILIIWSDTYIEHKVDGGYSEAPSVSSTLDNIEFNNEENCKTALSMYMQKRKEDTSGAQGGMCVPK
ncbi:MAG: hypothetical protein GKR94_06135 [Gammaproteobacteria bacterium]|nr:hypothetical protein [Gammaproteobacteria bacterium]